MSSTQVLSADRLRGAAREVSVRALRGVARRARRREGGVGAGGDRPPLRRPLHPRAARVPSRRRAGGGRTTRSGLYRLRKTCEGGLAAAELAEREDELENRFLATRVTFQGEEMPLAQRAGEAGRAARATPTARSWGGSRRRRAPRSTRTGSSCMQASEELAADLSGIADPIERNEEEKAISLHELSRALQAASVEATESYVTLRERWFARLLGDDREDIPSSYHTAWMRRLSTLEETYPRERRDGDLPAHTRGARLRSGRATEHQARSRRPAAEVAACVRDRERSAEDRASDHACAGRPARLPGVPARGRPCAALRGLRPEAAVRLPAHLARPCADGDLLVHRRGDLARAGVARASLRLSRPSRRGRTPRRRRSWRRCSIAGTRRSCATSSTSGRGSRSTVATARCTSGC